MGLTAVNHIYVLYEVMHGCKNKACFENVNILYIQTLHIDCSRIEDVYLLFCSHLINIYSFSSPEPLAHGELS